MNAEEWRLVVGHQDYEISDQGRVRSFKVYRGSTGPRILSTRPNVRTGYMQFAVKTEGKGQTLAIHAEMMRAFVGPRLDGFQVRHLDGDKSNNHLDNLTYGTVSENNRDQVEHGTHPWAKRDACKHGHAFTPENTVVETTSGKTIRRCRACKIRNGQVAYARQMERLGRVAYVARGAKHGDQRGAA